MTNCNDRTITTLLLPSLSYKIVQLVTRFEIHIACGLKVSETKDNYSLQQWNGFLLTHVLFHDFIETIRFLFAQRIPAGVQVFSQYLQRIRSTKRRMDAGIIEPKMITDLRQLYTFTLILQVSCREYSISCTNNSQFMIPVHSH